MSAFTIETKDGRERGAFVSPEGLVSFSGMAAVFSGVWKLMQLLFPEWPFAFTLWIPLILSLTYALVMFFYTLFQGNFGEWKGKPGKEKSKVASAILLAIFMGAINAALLTLSMAGVDTAALAE